MKVEYGLWPQEKFAELSDEFVVLGCRVWFRGGFLAVEAISEKADPATVANAYAAALLNRMGCSRLLSMEEFGALPPRAIAVVGLAKRESEHRRRQLGEARRDIVARVHPRLSQSYDYFQAARDDQEHALIHLYKMIESIEEAYGSEVKTTKALGVEPLKTLKKLANDRSTKSRDQRHAPVSPGTGTPLTDAERARALDDGRALLRNILSPSAAP